MLEVLIQLYLAVVNGESHGQNILGVAHKAAGGGAGVQIPQAQGAVPRTSQAELAIGGDDHVLDEVGVTLQGPLGIAIVVSTPLQLPDNDGPVTAVRSKGSFVLLLDSYIHVCNYDHC